jgi:hypothetical protein
MGLQADFDRLSSLIGPEGLAPEDAHALGRLRAALSPAAWVVLEGLPALLATEAEATSQLVVGQTDRKEYGGGIVGHQTWLHCAFDDGSGRGNAGVCVHYGGQGFIHGDQEAVEAYAQRLARISNLIHLAAQA